MMQATLRTLPSDGGKSTLEGLRTSAGELTAPLSPKSGTLLSWAKFLLPSMQLLFICWRSGQACSRLLSCDTLGTLFIYTFCKWNVFFQFLFPVFPQHRACILLRNLWNLPLNYKERQGLKVTHSIIFFLSSTPSTISSSSPQQFSLWVSEPNGLVGMPRSFFNSRFWNKG